MKSANPPISHLEIPKKARLLPHVYLIWIILHNLHSIHHYSMFNKKGVSFHITSLLIVLPKKYSFGNDDRTKQLCTPAFNWIQRRHIELMYIRRVVHVIQTENDTNWRNRVHLLVSILRVLPVFLWKVGKESSTLSIHVCGFLISGTWGILSEDESPLSEILFLFI